MPSSTRRIPVIGLAGGIGAGKSEVARILSAAGCVVADSDAAGRAALRDEAIKATLVGWWGEGILDETSGEIDRGRVARIVFNDPAQRRRLESLTHPWIEARRREEFAVAPATTRALVIDAPLLLEAGLDRECQAVIFVDAPRKLRLERIKKARGWDEAELDRRESSQMPLDEKRRRADHVVRNDGDLNALGEQVHAVLNAITPSGNLPPEDSDSPGRGRRSSPHSR